MFVTQWRHIDPRSAFLFQTRKGGALAGIQGSGPVVGGEEGPGCRARQRRTFRGADDRGRNAPAGWLPNCGLGSTRGAQSDFGWATKRIR